MRSLGISREELEHTGRRGIDHLEACAASCNIIKVGETLEWHADRDELKAQPGTGTSLA